MKRRADGEPGANGTPRCPAWLTGEARKVWRRMMDRLEATGILSGQDEQALARYCHTFVRWRECEDFISNHGMVYPLKDEAGGVRCIQTWPQVYIANQLAAHLMKLEMEFGLTPASRTRVRAEKQEVQSTEGKGRFFNGPRIAIA